MLHRTCVGDQCCYLYGSEPSNDSVCAIGGRALGLSCYVYNPHIPFTDFTVRWFRSDNVTSMAPLTGEQIIESHEYQHYREYANRPIHGQTFNSCSNASIYRDAFFLVITNFTPDKNGYYWCQIVVNGTVSQPSQYVWIYAADNSSCTPPMEIFTLIPDPRCADLQGYANRSQIHEISGTQTTVFSGTPTVFSGTQTTVFSGTPTVFSGTQTTVFSGTPTVFSGTQTIVISSPKTYEGTLHRIYSTSKSRSTLGTSNPIAQSVVTTFEEATGTPKSTTEPLLYITGLLSVLVAILLFLLLLSLLCVHKSRRQGDTTCMHVSIQTRYCYPSLRRFKTVESRMCVSLIFTTLPTFNTIQ